MLVGSFSMSFMAIQSKHVHNFTRKNGKLGSLQARMGKPTAITCTSSLGKLFSNGGSWVARCACLRPKRSHKFWILACFKKKNHDKALQKSSRVQPTCLYYEWFPSAKKNKKKNLWKPPWHAVKWLNISIHSAASRRSQCLGQPSILAQGEAWLRTQFMYIYRT